MKKVIVVCGLYWILFYQSYTQNQTQIKQILLSELNLMDKFFDDNLIKHDFQLDSNNVKINSYQKKNFYKNKCAFDLHFVNVTFPNLLVIKDHIFSLDTFSFNYVFLSMNYRSEMYRLFGSFTTDILLLKRSFFYNPARLKLFSKDLKEELVRENIISGSDFNKIWKNILTEKKRYPIISKGKVNILNVLFPQFNYTTEILPYDIIKPVIVGEIFQFKCINKSIKMLYKYNKHMVLLS